MAELPRRGPQRDGWSVPGPDGESHYVLGGFPACGLHGFYGGIVSEQPPDRDKTCLECLFAPDVPGTHTDHPRDIRRQ